MSRQGRLIALTIVRPVATTMVVLAIATFGAISLQKIPIELLPEVSYPTITVRTEYKGAGPEDVEERVSKRVEEGLAVLPGLEQHTSVSRAGVSDVVLEFAWGTNLSFATQEIRERLDRTPLPDDAESPIILRYDPALDPIVRLSVFGDRDLRTVRLAADEVVKRGLESIPGVAAVKVRGGLEEEIRVQLDGVKLSSLSLDISEVDRRLKIENVNLASGTLIEGDTEYLVRTLNQFLKLDEILALAITDRDGQPIRIADVATVERTYKKRDVITRVGGAESVELLVYREADANIVDLAQRVRDRLYGSARARQLLADIASGKQPDPEVLLAAAMKKAEADKDDPNQQAEAAQQAAGDGAARGSAVDPEVQRLRQLVAEKRAAGEILVNKLASGLEVRVLSDQSQFISQAIGEVQGAAFIGGGLAILILLLFLKNAAATAIIAVSIPISIVATFACMFLSGTTLNIMSLGGLALGVGMLVDNSIVVLESIFRCREEGDDAVAAAQRGAGEVGLAVFASTLTTVAVFFPIVFVSGVAGQIFGDQSLTVVFSLLSSLAVALFFIPMLAARGQKGARPLTPAQVRARPLAALAGAFAPVVFWNRTLAVRGYCDLLRARKGPRRAAAAVLVAPVLALHLPIEIAGRILLSLGMALAFVIALCFRLLTLAVRVLGFPLQLAFDGAFTALQRVYAPLLRTVLTHPLALALLFTGAAGAAAASWRLFDRLGTEMLPTVHQGELLAHLYTRVGTPVESTAASVLPFELAASALPGVAEVASAVGIARDEVAEPDEGGHSARVLVRLAPARDMAAAEEQVLAGMRGLLEGRPEYVSFRFSRPTLFSIKAPLEVQARGNDLVQLREAAAEIAARMRESGAVTDVRSTVARGSPEVRLTFDRERLRRFGLDIEAIANRVRAQVQGVVSTRFAEGERRIDVRVLGDVATVDQLLDLTVNRGRAVDLADTLDRGAEGGGGSSGTGSTRIRDRTLFPGTAVDLGTSAPIPLRQVADVEVIEGPSEIRRIRGQRAAVVTANAIGLDVGGSAGRIEALLPAIEAKYPSTLCAIGGQGAEMGAALDGMKLALLLAVFLVYIVMAAQFESILQPLVILVTIPLAVVGAILAMYVTSTPVSVVTLIGGIVLAGIVVNNAIVLVDYTNQLRERGMSVVDALVEAGRARLRPILMTTTTTVLGLLPLMGALERIPGLDLARYPWLRGSELQAPMAVAVVGGLCMSTLLTLLVIPAVYRLVARDRAPAAESVQS